MGPDQMERRRGVPQPAVGSNHDPHGETIAAAVPAPPPWATSTPRDAWHTLLTVWAVAQLTLTMCLAALWALTGARGTPPIDACASPSEAPFPFNDAGVLLIEIIGAIVMFVALVGVVSLMRVRSTRRSEDQDRWSLGILEKVALMSIPTTLVAAGLLRVVLVAGIVARGLDGLNC